MTSAITPEPFEGDSIRDAQSYLRVHMKRGAICPCCKQHVKVYKRPLGAPMARWLVWLVRTFRVMIQQCDPASRQRIWVDIRKAPVRGGDYAKLVHWGLIEQKPKDPDKDTRDSGMWRPTSTGIEFVYRRIKVPSHVFLYANRRQRVDDDTVVLIDIVQALGKKFSYREVMSADINVEVPL